MAVFNRTTKSPGNTCPECGLLIVGADPKDVHVVESVDQTIVGLVLNFHMQGFNPTLFKTSSSYTSTKYATKQAYGT
jgi:hypothetical protein